MARTIAKDHDQKRSVILKSAARLFAREGLARASMAQVAREAEISKANIYHYYAGKEALLFDILDSNLSRLKDHINSVPATGLTAVERFKLTVREILLAYEGTDDEHRLLSEGLPLLPGEYQSILRGHQRELVDIVAAILNDAAPQVFTDDPGKLHGATMSVFGMLNWYYMWKPNATRTAREEYADLVTNLTFKGLPGL